MEYEIDKQITQDYVYEVSMEFYHAKNGKAKYQTCFNLNQPDVSVRRGIRELKLDKEKVTKVTVTMIQQLGQSQIKIDGK